MRVFGDEHRETEGAQAALVPLVNDLEDLTETSEDAGQPDDSPRPEPTPVSPRMRAAPWVIAVSAVILASTLLLMLADVQRTNGESANARPTPTPPPTATLAPTPSPTPMEGFQYYVDRSNHYLIQYPVGWIYSPASPGIEFADDTNSPGYIVQVLLPTSLTTTGPDTDPSDAAAWVNYELDNLSKQWPQGSFTRVPGSAPPAATPTPAASGTPAATAVPTATPTAAPTTTPASPSCVLSQKPVTIGGKAWQTGGGLVQANDTRICVQVYATVVDGRPYIINLIASDEHFIAGNIEFFTPMLRSFQFLQPTS
jgi:hypothetical protein